MPICEKTASRKRLTSDPPNTRTLREKEREHDEAYIGTLAEQGRQWWPASAPDNQGGESSPEQSEAAIRSLSDAGTACNLAHYIRRDIQHGRAVDCNKVRIDGWFTRRELALVLSLMPEDAGP